MLRTLRFPGSLIAARRIGGTQTISVIDHATGEILNIPYAPTFDGEGFEVTDHAGNDVALESDGPAIGHLWLDDEEGRVMDRIQVETGVARVAELRTSVHGDMLAWFGFGVPAAILAGAEAVLAIALFETEGGVRVTDESMSIEAVSGEVTRTGWDEIIVRADAGDVAVAVTAAGMAAPVTLTIPTVAEIDAAGWYELGNGNNVGEVATVCAIGLPPLLDDHVGQVVEAGIPKLVDVHCRLARRQRFERAVGELADNAVRLQAS